MKFILSLLFSLATASASDNVLFSTNYFTQSRVNGDPSAVVLADQAGSIVISASGKANIPSIAIQNEGPGLYLSATKEGGHISIYRNVNGRKHEWLRVSSEGITLFNEFGEAVKGFSGTIGPRCRPVFSDGFAIGQDCAQHP